jgi:biopolymer transport protein ExbB
MPLCNTHSRSVRRGSWRALVTTALGAFAVTSSSWLTRGQSIEDGTVMGAASLPRDLSPLGMYFNADPVVKAVLLCLVFASVVTWTVWLAKTIEIFRARRRVRADLATLGTLRSTPEAAEALSKARTEVGEFINAASLELEMSSDFLDRDGVKERVASRLERIEAARGRRAMRGTGALATIGATAPFVGLFGTVWGIMNSFIGISKSHTTNLAVVAPGIAEALLATAFGLIAAIPAVVIYNMFSRSIAGYRAQLGDASAEVLRLVSRDLDGAAGVRDSSVRRTLSAAR